MPEPTRPAATALRRHAVWSVSAVLVCVMILAAVAIGRASLASAKTERLTERANLVQKLLEYAGGSYDPVRLATSAARMPFDPDDPEVNRRLLASFMTGPTGDQVTSAALIRLDGTVQTFRPATTPPPGTDQLGPAWQAARSGSPARSAVLDLDGRPALAIAVPVGGLLSRWAVLVVTQRVAVTSAQKFVSDLGSLGQGRGGISMLDRNGIAAASWNPSRLGHPVLTPGEVAGLADGAGPRTTSEGGTTTIALRRGDFVGVFQQPTAALFADLEAGQRQRDRTLIGVLLLALAGVLTVSVRQARSAGRDRRRMHALLAGAHDLVLVTGDGGRLTFVSPNLPELLGHGADDWTGTRLADHLHPDDQPRLERLLAAPEDVQTARDVRLLAPDGTYRWFDLEAGDLSGERLLSGVLLTCRDTGRRKDLEDQLLDQARRDPLTGLANRASLLRELGNRLAWPGPPRLAVLFIDLDGFKQVNDGHGHEAGDRLLATIGARLGELVGEDGLVARYGGDEFVVMLGSSDEAVVQAVAERIVDSVGRPVPIGADVTVQVGASVGIALAAAGVRRPEVLLRAADRAMYEAKRAGGGTSTAAGIWLMESATGWGDHGDHFDRSSQIGPNSQIGHSNQISPGAAVSSEPPVVRRRRARSGVSRSAGTGPGRFLEARWLVAIVATVLAIVAVAGIGLAGAMQAQRSAERQRVDERLEITGRVADYAAAVASPDRLRGPVNSAPWELDGSVVDVFVLQAVLQSELGGAGARGALYRPSGKLLTGDADATFAPVSPGTRAFRTALNGDVGFVPLILRGGVAYAGYAIPIERQGQVAAVLLIGQPLAESVSQSLLELLGSLGFGAGGISSVLPDGTVTHSWNPRLIGTRIVTAEDLRRADGSMPALVAGTDDEVTLAARMDIAAAGYGSVRKYIVLQQPTWSFYAGIRDTGRERNLALLGGVLLCLLVIGLGGLQHGRQEQRDRRRLDALLRNAHDIVVVTHQGRIDFISSAAEMLLGRHPDSCAGRALVDLVHPDHRGRAADFVDGRTGDTLQDVQLLQADGTSSWFDLHRTDLTHDPDLRGVVLTCQEIGERKMLGDQLAHLVQHDGLTGLPNRARVHDELARYTGADPLPCTVLFVDLDRFKPVNDTHGHEAGDALLRSIARRLVESVQDVEGALAARIGGDEFAVLLPGDGPGRPILIADRILRAVAEPVPVWSGQRSTGQHEPRQVSVGATIGIARNRPGDSPAELLGRADRAMYEGKGAGRGRYAVDVG